MSPDTESLWLLFIVGALYEDLLIIKLMNTPQHLIEITKEKKKYIVRCVGDYADIVRGRTTAYEFSKGFTTFAKAIEYAKKKMSAVREDYKECGKKANVKLIEQV